jgi:thiamine biosynthesis lipoprotein
MNRREFLQPGRHARAVGLVQPTSALPAKTHSRHPFCLIRAARSAMATTFEVVLPFGTAQAQAVAEAALDQIDQVEDQLTIYRDGSEVSRLNRLACTDSFSVDEKLFELLVQCARLTELTEGAFDVSTGALIKAWGLFRRRQRIPSPEELAESLARVGMTHVLLDATNRSVKFARPGLEVNFGSIGKGYALDQGAARLRSRYGVPAALLHGGHSSVYAWGSEPGHARGWAVGIRHPWDTERRLARVWLRDRALGTSAATFQHLENAGRRLGHHLDPRTGRPAEGMASASAVAATAAEADALATAFYIQGIEWTRAFCGRHPEVGAILLAEGASARPVLFNLAAPTVDLLASPE